MISKEKNNMFNLPNKITLFRMIMMPVLIFFFLADFIPGNKLIALIIFFVSALSDMVDGYIARHYNMVTALGKLLDPIADKLLATTALCLLMVGNTSQDPILILPVGLTFMFIMLFRDYTVTGLRQFAQLRGVVIMADKVAKLKANFLYATLFYGLLIAFLKDVVTHATALLVLDIILYVLVAITSILIIISLVNYIIITIKYTKGKEELKFESNKI